MAILVRYGEIGLKGHNRPYFEKQLVKNIKYFNKEIYIDREPGRMIINTEKNLDLSKIYGITSYSYAVVTNASMENIKKEAFKLYRSGTFRVHTQRLTKILLPSLELSREVGAYIIQETGAKVDLKNPDQTINIEIIEDKAYLFTEKIPGLGGLPAGVEGVVAVLGENQDAILAAKEMLKRGCKVILVEKENINTEELEKYCPFPLKKVKEIPEYVGAVVTAETLETLKERDYDKLVLKPLLAKWQE